MKLDQLIDDAYSEIKSQIESKQLDLSDSFVLVARTMELVESKYKISGAEKKTIVMNVIQRSYNDFVKNNTSPSIVAIKPFLGYFVESDQLSKVIEVIILSSRGLIKLNSGKKGLSCCKSKKSK